LQVVRPPLVIFAMHDEALPSKKFAGTKTELLI